MYKDAWGHFSMTRYMPMHYMAQRAFIHVYDNERDCGLDEPIKKSTNHMKI